MEYWVLNKKGNRWRKRPLKHRGVPVTFPGNLFCGSLGNVIAWRLRTGQRTHWLVFSPEEEKALSDMATILFPTDITSGKRSEDLLSAVLSNSFGRMYAPCPVTVAHVPKKGMLLSRGAILLAIKIDKDVEVTPLLV